MGIARNIVMRFTGLLFSNRRQPRVAVPGDTKTEGYLNAMLKDGSFWPAMIQARNYGGATGSACIGYKFVGGRPLFEALDPRWVTPEFEGRGYTDPKKLTIQYTYSKEEWVDDKWKTVWYWYRRVIDTESDTVWVPVRCREKEPAWDFIQSNRVVHNLGFVPYEWIQNFRVDDETDGDPDCFPGQIHLNFGPDRGVAGDGDVARFKGHFTGGVFHLAFVVHKHRARHEMMSIHQIHGHVCFSGHAGGIPRVWSRASRPA
jgi:hypothetical protein